MGAVITKHFDARKHEDLRQQIVATGMNNAAKEPHFKVIGRDILEEFEGFHSILDGPSTRELPGTPFDFIAIQGGVPAIVELKGSLKSFVPPGSTQRVRLERLLNLFDSRKIQILPYLLQIKLDRGEYRMWNHEKILQLFSNTDKSLGRSTPLEPIFDWITERLCTICPAPKKRL